MQELKKAVRKFLAEYNLYDEPLTSKKLEEIISSQSFEIIYYDVLHMSEKAQYLADRLDLHNKCQTSNGFTYCNRDIKLVYVKQNLNEKDKRSVLLHEEGHIYLDHFYRQGLEETTTQHETAARTFAVLVQQELQRNKTKWLLRIITPAAGAFILSAILIFRACSPNVSKPVRDALPATQTELLIPSTSDAAATHESEPTSDPAPDTVYKSASETDPDTRTYYWTGSGTVYHMYADCQHLKNSVNVQSGTKDQSKKERCCKTCYSRYLSETYTSE